MMMNEMEKNTANLYQIKSNKNGIYVAPENNYLDYLQKTSHENNNYNYYLESISLTEQSTIDHFENYLKSASEFIINNNKNNEVIIKLYALSEKLKSLNDTENYYNESLFSLLRTLPFYADMNYVDFFLDEERKIIGINIQKEKQSLTMQFCSKNMIEYSYAYKSTIRGVFRMTGRAKLTSSLMNSHFIKKVINSIR